MEMFKFNKFDNWFLVLILYALMFPLGIWKTIEIIIWIYNHIHLGLFR